MSGLEALLAGKTLVKRYEIQEVIGRGGFAAVYRADDLRLGRPVAVKVITAAAPDSDTRDRLHARFEREARSAASLPHHPNLVTVHDFGTDPETGIDFLVMELLTGETLAQHLAREKRPPLGRTLQILCEAAEGLAVGHRSGLVHRDVKPGNLFLAELHGDEPFRVVVLDFGIARIADDDTHDITRTAMGENPLSPAYASPEQLRGDRNLTPAADVFGLGVVAYQLLAGEKPFAADPGQRARGRGAVRPLREMNPQVPPAVIAVVERAMAERPEDRFPDAGAFADALEQAAGPDDRTMVFAPGAPDDDDATLLAPAAVLAGAAAASRAPDRTVAAPEPPRPVAPPPPPPPAGRPPVSEPARKRSPMGAILLVLLLLAGGAAAAVWAFGGGGGSGDADEGVATAPGDSVTETTDGATDERIDGTILPSPAETPPSGGGDGGDDGGIVGDGDGSPVIPGGTAPPADPGETPAQPSPPAGSQPTVPVPPPASGGQPTVPVTPSPPPAQPQPTPPVIRPTPPVQPPRQQPVPRPTPPPAPAPAPAPPPAPPPAPAPPPVLGRPTEPRPATPAPNPNAPRDTIVLPTRQPSTPGPASPAAPGTTP